MYYPQNKIKTNLYTIGGEITDANGRDYKGYYWKDFKGRFFKGKTPNSTPQGVQLYPPLSSPNFAEINPNNETLTIVTDRGLAGPYNIFYTALRGINPNDDKLLINTTFPTPSESDYIMGYFNRFFFYKNNTQNFGETDSEAFKDVKNNQDKYPKGLYNLFTLKWLIKGNREKVINYNTTSVSNVERIFNDSSFASFLGYNYLKFYQEDENQQSSTLLPPPSSLTTYTSPTSGRGTSFSGGGGY